jgi:hypothetical protein
MKKIKNFLIGFTFIFVWTLSSLSFAEDDPYRRYILIHNDLPITVYPVVQLPEDGNCNPGSTKVRRLTVNHGEVGTGIPFW